MAEDDTEDHITIVNAATLVILERIGWRMEAARTRAQREELERVRRARQWAVWRRRRRLAVLWGIAVLSALAAVLASGWRP